MTVDDDGQPQRVTSRDLWVAMTRVETKLDGLSETLARMDTSATDLERRVRDAEQEIALLKSSQPVKEGLSVRAQGLAAAAALVVAIVSLFLHLN